MSRDEILKTEEEFKVAMARVLKARAAIIAKIGKRTRIRGQIVCPIDGGALHYSRASNGHIHAQCSNSTCVRWME